jgi:hypothetical protein
MATSIAAWRWRVGGGSLALLLLGGRGVLGWRGGDDCDDDDGDGDGGEIGGRCWLIDRLMVMGGVWCLDGLWWGLWWWCCFGSFQVFCWGWVRLRLRVSLGFWGGFFFFFFFFFFALAVYDISNFRLGIFYCKTSIYCLLWPMDNPSTVDSFDVLEREAQLT